MSAPTRVDAPRTTASLFVVVVVPVELEPVEPVAPVEPDELDVLPVAEATAEEGAIEVCVTTAFPAFQAPPSPPVLAGSACAAATGCTPIWPLPIMIHVPLLGTPFTTTKSSAGPGTRMAGFGGSCETCSVADPSLATEKVESLSLSVALGRGQDVQLEEALSHIHRVRAEARTDDGDFGAVEVRGRADIARRECDVEVLAAVAQRLGDARRHGSRGEVVVGVELLDAAFWSVAGRRGRRGTHRYSVGYL